jgi:hypothetical protein
MQNLVSPRIVEWSERTEERWAERTDGSRQGDSTRSRTRTAPRAKRREPQDFKGQCRGRRKDGHWLPNETHRSDPPPWYR